MSGGDTEQKVVFAKLDTGQDGEEVLGYLEVEPSSDNTFFLQSRQIEIDGEHVILAHEDENGDFFVVVEAEQENPQSAALLVQGLVKESAQPGTSQETPTSSASTSDGGQKKQAGNQRLFQLASVAQNQLGETKVKPKAAGEENGQPSKEKSQPAKTRQAEGTSTSARKPTSSKDPRASSSDDRFDKLKSEGKRLESQPSVSNFDDEDLFDESSSKKEDAKKGSIDLTQQVNDVINLIDSSLDEAEALIAQDKLEIAQVQDAEALETAGELGRAKRKLVSGNETPIKKPRQGGTSSEKVGSEDHLAKVSPPPKSEEDSSKPKSSNPSDLPAKQNSKKSPDEESSEIPTSDEAPKCNMSSAAEENVAKEEVAKSDIDPGIQSKTSSDPVAKSRPKRLRKTTKDQQTTNGSGEDSAHESSSRKEDAPAAKTSDTAVPTSELKEDPSASNNTEDAAASPSTSAISNPTPDVKKTDLQQGKKKRKPEASKETPSTPKRKKVVDIFDLLKKQKTPSYTPGLLHKYSSSPVPSFNATHFLKKAKLKKPKFTAIISELPPQNGINIPDEMPPSPPRKRVSRENKGHKEPFEVRIRIQPTPPVSTTTYKCFKCPFSTTRIDNMVRHHKYRRCSNKETSSHDFNWEVDQLPSARPEPPPATKPPSTPAPKKSADSSSKMKVSNPLESSESEDDDSGDSSQPKIKTGDVVWVEWRDLHRPALIQEVLSKERKALVTYIEHNTCAKPSVKVSIKRIATFDNAERNKRFLSESKSTSFGESVVKAVARAEDYLRKKCLGYEVTANHFFFGEGAAIGVSLEPEDLEPLPPGETPLSDVSDMESETEEETNDPEKRKERKKKLALKLIKIAKGRHVKAHLLGVYSTAISSERHRKFHSTSQEERNELKQVSWFGPIDDEDQQEEMFEYFLSQFKTNCKYGKSYDLVAYTFEVWVPEALVKAMSRLYKVSLEEAEKMFVAGKQA